MPNETITLTRRDAAEAPLLLNTIQTATELNISKRSLQELVADRKIGFIKFGRNIRFDRADIAAFIDSHRRQPVGWKAGGSRGVNP